MSGSPTAVEIDFFRLKDEESSSHNKKLADHRSTTTSSSRDIQGVISKINPELLKTAIASASAKKQKTTTHFVKQNSTSSWHPPHHLLLQTLPVYNNNKQDYCGNNNNNNNNNNNVKSHNNVAPLTIFYNGSVSVFDVSADQADKIMKLAENASPGSKTDGGEVVNNNHQNNSINDNDNNGEELLGGVLAGRSDLPMLRKKSLRRFLEKRKERQVTINPYACSQGSEC
uniref:protein TIFY 9-like n=1 Tax=Erigeron canadensis TaxID=72917 RepID=UPI001CB9CBF7|nr:protein TIFY 9-like [Erigeron canadensis]